MSMSSPGFQHAANTAAVIVPMTTLWAHAPEIVTVMLGLLGIVWYAIQIGEWVAKKRASWSITKTTTVTETLQAATTAEPPPHPHPAG